MTLDDQYIFSCAGVGIHYPSTRFEKNRIIVSVKANKDASPAPEGFCDEEDQELFKFDTRTIDAKHKKKLDQWIEFENYEQRHLWWADMIVEGWFDTDNLG